MGFDNEGLSQSISRRESGQRDKLVSGTMGRHVNGKWLDFPDPPKQDQVLQWISNQQEFFTGQRGVYYTTTNEPLQAHAITDKSLDAYQRDAMALLSLHGRKISYTFLQLPSFGVPFLTSFSCLTFLKSRTCVLRTSHPPSIDAPPIYHSSHM
jgi:hypothetical protein